LHTEVDAPCATVVGLVDDGVHVFRGIPYAQPPVGALRFAPPEPLTRQDHIDATRFGAVSLQEIDPLPLAVPGTEHNFYTLDVVASEDCLSVNVWTADPDGSAPVYVYIHGGAFLYGSGTGPWISGANLAKHHGIVVVTLNYRLGLLGGLYLGDYDRRSSNLALQDQIQALRWVQENIAAFGGDTSRVTVGGESAGAMSVIALLTAPAARGLFQRAVVESGHADAMMTVEQARSSTTRVLEALHIDPSAPDVLDRLRAVSTFRIGAVQREFGIAVRTFPLVTDEYVLPSDPLGEIGDGCARDIDLVLGSMREEDRLFTITGWGGGERSIESTVSGLLPDAVSRERAVAMYEALRSADADDDAITYWITGDHGWGEPLRRLALAHSSSGGRTYHYEFAWASAARDGAVGAAHLVDLPFFFGNLDAPGVTDLLGEEARTDLETLALGQDVSATLAEFVRSGDLSSSPVGVWRPFTATDRATMILDRGSELVVDHLAERLDFWADQHGVSAAPLSALGAGE
jgi:para-nitrobenzyl esterase